MIEYHKDCDGVYIDRNFLSPDDFSNDDRYTACLVRRITELSDHIDLLANRAMTPNNEVLEIINALQANRSN